MPDEGTSLGHLAHFEVRGLFGDRRFSFDLDRREPTLLTGSNGTGKSTVLRIIDAIGTGEWQALSRLPFKTATLRFESGELFTCDHRVESLHFSCNGMTASLPLLELDQGFEEEEWRFHPEAIQIGRNLFEHRGRTVTGAQLSQVLRRERVLTSPDRQWLAQFPERFPILFVTDQRLVVLDDRQQSAQRATRVRNRTAVELSARELARQMQQVLSAYAQESQRLDRDFPQRVVRAMASEDEVPVERLEKLLVEVEAERKALQGVGLLPRDLGRQAFQDLPLHEPHVRPVIETFIRDSQVKFEVLKDFRERLTLFNSFLNQHYADTKKVVTDPREGFVVAIEGDPERKIEPSRLSSGEQQILVLAYEVLFRSQHGTLVLIDEPELSLHVLWQDTFIDDLTRMSTVRDLRFILATHSPTLIGGRSDLKRSMDSALRD
jgi:ABC-type transport system involved in cytochrome c biogenesis ATPase subunit